MSHVIFPKFEECREFTFDKYWQDIFSECARNKFPKGLRYDHDKEVFTVKVDKKKVEIIETPKDVIKLFRTMMSIFREKLGIASSLDTKISKEKFEESKNKEILSDDWKKIKPRSLRERLLMDYVKILNKKYQLSLAEVRQLIATIHLGFQFRNLTSDNVVYENKKVKKIIGLSFNKTTRKFKTTKTKASISKTEKTTGAGLFYPVLDKFIRDNTARVGKLKY